ncbi:MAG: ABC transporter ATP-binding protein [Alphaproteobacteria bacterium]|nr:ABC transporter ATP-binding protein [Alphaproteobacteria bacterium]
MEPTNQSKALAAGKQPVLPSNIFRYVVASGGFHQLFLVALTVVVFLIEIVPLELQRRVVNDLVKHRAYQTVIVLCLAYAGVVLFHGSTKLALNVYRGWIGERAGRDLRQRVSGLLNSVEGSPHVMETSGIGVSMVVSEVEPIGGFIGESLSEPLLQGGILLSVIAYMIHLETWMAAAALAFFLPQLVLVPLLQGSINRRNASRVWILRKLSVNLVTQDDTPEGAGSSSDPGIERLFEVDMGIFKLKFTMNFLMNLCNHLQVITALLVGGWYVLTDQLEIGGVVAFISAIGRLNDPWGDLVNYFRDVSGTQVRYRLLAGAVNRLAEHRELGIGEALVASD